MKSLMLLWKVVLEDLGTRCSVCTILDFKQGENRIEHEGLSFFTITLPTFAKDFEKSLEQRCVTDDLFSGFRKSGGLPVFLGGFLQLVFSRRDGVLLPSVNEDAVFSIRQATMLFGKLEGICTPSRERAAIVDFVKCEEDLCSRDAERTADSMTEFANAARRLFGPTLQKVEQDLSNWNFRPKHGPGATADKLRGNAKYNQRTWPVRLEEFFPAGEMLLPNWRYREQLEGIQFLDPGSEVAAKLTSVPKTMKAPRLIAIEPTAMQYAQQSLMELLVARLEDRHDNLFPNLIGFTDQSLNRRLAREGSLSGNLATLDLSEASDRVSNQLVMALTASTPFLSGSLQACRSTKVDVPGHGLLDLAKFASMGSAVCFPLQAMVFATIILVGIERQHSTRLTHRQMKLVMSSVRVYGDDIIVPTQYAVCVVKALEAFGLKVNLGKSFWTGKFRESCGGDFYNGVDVTPIRCRTKIASRRTDVREIVSTVSLRNQLYYAGLWGAARHLDNCIGRLIPFPTVAPTSRIQGRHSHLGYVSQRLHPTLHSPLVRGMVVFARLPINSLDGYGALVKWFLKRSDLPFASKDHLERSGRPDSVYIKSQWASPF